MSIDLPDADPYLARELEVLDLRGELGRHLADAVEVTARAEHALARLAGPSVYDVELAEGHHGRDLAALLAAGGRDLRAALAILRTLPD